MSCEYEKVSNLFYCKCLKFDLCFSIAKFEAQQMKSLNPTALKRVISLPDKILLTVVYLCLLLPTEWKIDSFALSVNCQF